MMTASLSWIPFPSLYTQTRSHERYQRTKSLHTQKENRYDSRSHQNKTTTRTSGRNDEKVVACHSRLGSDGDVPLTRGDQRSLALALTG